jgi:hypothetical protein
MICGAPDIQGPAAPLTINLAGKLTGRQFPGFGTDVCPPERLV